MEALLNFQTMVTDLTGMAIANASMLDEATAAAEAMTLALRMGKSKSKVFFVADDVLPQTLEVVRTRARPLGIEVLVGPADAGRRQGLLRRAVPVPGRHRPGARAASRWSMPCHARGGLVIVAADLLALTLLQAAGRVRRRHRLRQHAALRHAHGRRRPARRLPGHAGRAQALAAGPPGRRQRRRARRAGLPPRAADARAAHPPREGHVQHLHGAGAAGGDRQHVRRLPRPRGPAPHRAPRGARSRRSSPPGLEQRGVDVRQRARVRHAGDRHRPADRRRARARRRGRHEPAPRQRRPRCRSASTRPPRAPTCRRCGACSRRARPPPTLRRLRARRRAAPAGRAGAHQRLPHAPGLQHAPQRDRDAALHPPPVRQGPGAGPQHDPAGLVHDEAQRHQRDDPDHLARVRARASVRAGRPARGLPRCSTSSCASGSSRPPATPASACSPTPARRASTPACW